MDEYRYGRTSSPSSVRGKIYKMHIVLGWRIVYPSPPRVCLAPCSNILKRSPGTDIKHNQPMYNYVLKLCTTDDAAAAAAAAGAGSFFSHARSFGGEAHNVHARAHATNKID